MDEITNKLERCFANAFPGLDPVRIPKANAENVAEWDSVAQITLLSLVGEEFGFEVNFEDFEGATSFEAIRALVKQQAEG